MEDLTFTISGQHIAATSRVVIASGTYGHLHAGCAHCRYNARVGRSGTAVAAR